MSRTLWEEGRWPAKQVIRASAFVCIALAGFDILATSHVGWIFRLGFVALCALAALAVKPGEFSSLLVLPPLEVLGLAITLSVIDRGAIAPKGASFIEGMATGLARMSGALFVGYALFLAICAIRMYVISRGSLRLPAGRGRLGASRAQVAPEFGRQREDQ